MINACQIYTNDTLATSRKPAAKSASSVLPPPHLQRFKNFNSLYINTFYPIGLWKAGHRVLISLRHHFIHQDSRHPGIPLRWLAHLVGSRPCRLIAPHCRYRMGRHDDGDHRRLRPLPSSRPRISRHLSRRDHWPHHLHISRHILSRWPYHNKWLSPRPLPQRRWHPPAMWQRYRD